MRASLLMLVLASQRGSRATSLLLGRPGAAGAAAAAVVRRQCAAGLRSGRARAATQIVASAPVARDPFFITTPIYYVNGDPHIGHAYTTLACDVIARWKRLDGHQVLFLTGTDEHGQKVEQSANAAGESPQALADRVSGVFRSLLPLYDFSCDRFIRTTEAQHKAAAQALWLKLVEAGDIYLGAYEGWYSVRDECFYTEDEIVEGRAPTGAPVEWVAESSYFFRLSRFCEPLVEYIAANPDFIQPASRRNEVLSFMREGLRDLSVSRTTFSWGIDVPANSDDANEHVMYVWLDALTNYISALGYPDVEQEDFTTFWPASVHMVGKDILRFHAIYWPAFLMAAGLPLPKRLFAHGWWTREGEKMSKSVGNVVDPFELVETYGCDQVRYFMMNEVAFGSDGDYSPDKMADCINAKLANDLGNLAYRTLSFAYKHCDGATPTPGELTAEDTAMLDAARALLPALRSLIDEFALHRVTQRLNMVVQQANRYIDTQAPWALRKTDTARMGTVLWVLMEVLRHVGILSQPVTPSLAAKLLDQLSTREEARQFEFLTPEHACVAGAALPKPEIIIPRYEPPEPEDDGRPVASAAASAVGLSEEEVAALVTEVTSAGDAVRELKDAGAGKEEVGAAVEKLLELKTRLPDGHELKSGGGGKKKKKKKAKDAVPS